MIPIISLFFRRRQELVLGIIVDHGFGQCLIIVVPLDRIQISLHKPCHLIHIEIQIRNILGLYIVKGVEIFNYFINHCFIHAIKYNII